MGFPSRNSFAQDYLGYFNGQVNNNTFLGLLGDSFNNFIAEHFSGVNQTQIRNELDVSFDYCRSQVISNREPDLSSARVNMLYQVNYPTNGSTRFDYEFSSSDSEIKCLRINKITDVDNNGHEMVRRYEYAETNYFFEKKVFSTKVLQNLIEVIPQIIPGGMGAPQCDLFRDWKRINFTYQGISPYFMTLFQGAPVLYNKVIEYNESSIANGPTLYFGKTEYTFSVDDDIIRRIPTLAKEVWFVQEDMSWKRGKLLSKIIYNSSGDIVLKEDYSYITSDDYGSVPYNIVKERQIAGIKIEKIQNLQMNSTNIDISQYFTLEKYYKRSHLCLLEKLTKSTYFDNAIHSIIQEDYEYNSRGLISSKSIRESDGSILKLKYSYPFEYFYTQYSPDERVIGLNGLINTNRFSEPIEIITYKDDKIIGGELNTYKYCAGILAPFERFQLNSSNPLIESSTESNSTFTPSRIESTGGNGYILMKDNFYKLDFVYSKYDLNGNLLQYNNENDIVKSFIWSDQSFFPVAVVANSLENVIAYTSFETTEFGNWVQPFYGTIRDDNNAKTGRKVFQLMGSEAIRKNLPAGEYKLEYYAKSPVSISGGIVSDIFTSAADQYGWILYQKKVSSLSSFDLSLTGYYVIIDEVRLCPFSAQMTTYTYDPLIGMTSQTDENNVTTYYEYDGFGRLNRVLDQDRNVIKQYEYNYSNKVQP
jgi:YD repeat-containing protein